MNAIKDTVSSYFLQRVLSYEVDEGLEEIDRSVIEYRYVIGAVGVIAGAGLMWRWIKRQKKKARLARSRKLKQQQRQKAFEKLSQLIQKSEMTIDQSEAITKLSSRELLDQIKDGRLSASQALTAYQIKALEVHKKTNCLVEPILEAEEWARELDLSELRGPLHGLPISIKDCVGIKGYDTTVGCSKWIGEPCKDDSVIIQVLKQQGAVPFVRTNIPQTMISFESTNPIYGRTVNPHDPTRTAGGSSGGEGALVAGGGSLCGIGSDVGGSIRNPGAMCGVPAFKPTSLRISKKGGRAILAGKNIQASYGPLARDVDCLITFVKAVLVPEMYRLDPVLPIIPFREEVLSDKRPLRIGYSFFNGAFEAVPAMRRGVEEARKLLEASGHELVPWDEQMSRVVELWAKCIFADSGEEMSEILDCDAVDDAMYLVKLSLSLPVSLRRLVACLTKPFRPEISRNLRNLCGFKTVSELWNAIKEIKEIQNGIIERWQKSGLDAIVCPAFGCPALSNGLQQHLTGVFSYTSAFNALDFPGGTVPVTVVTEKDIVAMENYPSVTKATESHWILKKDMKGAVGLPVSVQVVTLPWQDELCLRVMSDLEKAVRSHD